MKRQIIKIDEDLCNGCADCVSACHEGAIALVNGKAKLIRDDYCDGLGDCLPSCPTGAITFEEREAAAFDEQAVQEHMKRQQQGQGCPSSMARVQNVNSSKQTTKQSEQLQSELRQWPVQIKLVPSNASFFDNSKLLIAADCGAYAYANFHQEFMEGHITLIGCPKLDNEDYSQKLCEIISNNNILSVQVVRMEVPCCGGIEQATKVALQNSGKFIPWQITTISTDGQILK